LNLALTLMAVSGGGDDALPGAILGIFARDEGGASGQRSQIVELYDELRPSLFGYLISLGLTAAEADDMIQDAFVRLVRFLQSGGELKSPRSWIFRVARNAAFNLQKRERRLISSDEGADLCVASTADKAPQTPEQLYLLNERFRLLSVAIQQLTQRQRECLHLRAEGLRYHEIAEVLGTTTSAIADSLKRAILRLMSELDA
jgi:RNA polymerase sigma-70 factor (ECF subfamily)